ncbi:MAG: hypothetical protein JNL38_26985 [Myxococcales bacterium]|nr:hypothetical protein [Myxococcales bacterium]
MRHAARIAALILASLPATASAADNRVACVEASERGQLARDAGELLTARRELSLCAQSSCPNPLRADCLRWLEDVTGSIPSVVIGAKDDRGADLVDVRVAIDGRSLGDAAAGLALELDPGRHVARFERAGSEAVEVRFVLRAGERNRPILATFPSDAARPRPLPPTPAPGRGPSVATWAAGGVAVLGLTGFVTFAWLGADEKSRLRNTCSPRCTDDDVSKLRVDYVVADVSLVVAVIAAGVTTWLALTDRTAATPSQRFARSIWK